MIRIYFRIFNSIEGSHIFIMQLQIRGQETTVVECQNNETVQHIKVITY